MTNTGFMGQTVALTNVCLWRLCLWRHADTENGIDWKHAKFMSWHLGLNSGVCGPVVTGSVTVTVTITVT